MGRAAVVLLALVATLSVASAAEAGVAVGLGSYWAGPLAEAADTQGSGFGLQARAGYALPLLPVRLVPEVGALLLELPALDSSNPEHRVRAFTGGLRAGVGSPLRLSVWAHAGHGWLDGTGSDTVLNRRGLLLDAGVALDFVALPWLSAGLFGGASGLRYDAHSNDHDWDWERWVRVGAQVMAEF